MFAGRDCIAAAVAADPRCGAAVGTSFAVAGRRCSVAHHTSGCIVVDLLVGSLGLAVGSLASSGRSFVGLAADSHRRCPRAALAAAAVVVAASSDSTPNCEVAELRFEGVATLGRPNSSVFECRQVVSHKSVMSSFSTAGRSLPDSRHSVNSSLVPVSPSRVSLYVPA